MKKVFLSMVVAGFLMVGCGGGGGNTAPSIEQQPILQVNTLNIKGEEIDRNVVIDASKIVANVTTSATDPEVLVFFREGNNKYDARVFLQKDSQNANVQLNVIDVGVSEYDVSCREACEQGATYQMIRERDQDILNVQVNQKSFGVDTKLYQAPLIPVSLRGNLRIGFPAGWPVFQSKLFPQADVKGDFKFDGKTYRLISLGAKTVEEDNDVTKEITYNLTFKHGDESLFLEVYSYISPDRKGTYFTIHNNEDAYYSEMYSLSQPFFKDESKKITINFNNMELKSDANSSVKKTLQANLIAPKAYVQGTVNGSPWKIDGLSGSASATNDQKSYFLTLSTKWGGSVIKITHELKGHLSVKGDFGIVGSCGDRDYACSGLTLDADQKTYRFNQVKIGNQVYNGSLYIPGIFK